MSPKQHHCECSECKERGDALQQIADTPFTMANDAESLRHTIRTMQHVARTGPGYD